MTGRFAGPFNLFRNADARERLVKNYAAKLLANAERIVDRPGGSQLCKLVSQHGDLLFTAIVDKTGPRPLYRVFVSTPPVPGLQVTEGEEPISLDVFMESGFCDVLGIGESFDADIYYTAELEADLAAVGAGSSEKAWLDWIDVSKLRSISRVYVAGMPSLAMSTTGRLEEFRIGNHSAHSGKTLLLWQAIAGARDVSLSEYDGETIPDSTGA